MDVLIFTTNKRSRRRNQCIALSRTTFIVWKLTPILKNSFNKTENKRIWFNSTLFLFGSLKKLICRDSSYKNKTLWYRYSFPRLKYSKQTDLVLSYVECVSSTCAIQPKWLHTQYVNCACKQINNNEDVYFQTRPAPTSHNARRMENWKIKTEQQGQAKTNTKKGIHQQLYGITCNEPHITHPIYTHKHKQQQQ